MFQLRTKHEGGVSTAETIPDTGQFKAASTDLILNGGLYREWYQNGCKLGVEIILNYLVDTL